MLSSSAGAGLEEESQGLEEARGGGAIHRLLDCRGGDGTGAASQQSPGPRGIVRAPSHLSLLPCSAIPFLRASPLR